MSQLRPSTADDSEDVVVVTHTSSHKSQAASRSAAAAKAAAAANDKEMAEVEELMSQMTDAAADQVSDVAVS